MKAFTKYLYLSSALTLAFGASLASAQTVCANNGCSVTIATDPSAPNSNFQSPSLTANSGYTITTSDSGGNFTITLSDTNANALEFTNLYLDSNPGTAQDNGSDIGLSFGSSGGTGFTPGVAGSYSLDGTGITSVFSVDGNGYSDVVVIPNSFFEDDPTGVGFDTTAPEGLVTLHLSQSFSYSVAGGSGFGTPIELGGAVLTPEPSSLVLLGTGLLGVCGAARRRFIKA